MKREVQPELLDSLPASDPAAIRSRKDLRRVNACMTHARTLCHVLRQSCSQPPRRVVDLGGGDGTLMLRTAQGLSPFWKGVHVELVDRQHLLDPATALEFQNLGWSVEAFQQDVFEWASIDDQDRADLLVANLFLHHFETSRLRELLCLISLRANCAVACEPRRFRFSAAARALLWLIGCNAVTRHDGEISVRAGFRGSEISSLWPASDAWELEERAAGLFTHLFVARRSQMRDGGQAAGTCCS